MSDKTIIFYSGKLWHSDKPFPVKPGEQNYNPELRDHQYPDDLVIYWDKVKLWLSTAYEVVNPEVMPVVAKDREGDFIVLKTTNPKHWDLLSDGDQITLPEGYGIEKIRACLNDNASHPCDCMNCCAMKNYATITRPEPVSEPSESQEEPFSRSIQRDLRAFIPKMVSGELDDKLKLGYVQLINGKRVELILKIEVS